MTYMCDFVIHACIWRLPSWLVLTAIGPYPRWRVSDCDSSGYESDESSDQSSGESTRERAVFNPVVDKVVNQAIYVAIDAYRILHENECRIVFAAGITNSFEVVTVTGNVAVYNMYMDRMYLRDIPRMINGVRWYVQTVVVGHIAYTMVLHTHTGAYRMIEVDMRDPYSDDINARLFTRTRDSRCMFGELPHYA